MTSPPKKTIHIFDYIIILAFVGVVAFFYIGLFYPSEDIPTNYNIMRYALILALPIITAVSIYLYLAQRTGRLHRFIIPLVFGSAFFCIFCLLTIYLTVREIRSPELSSEYHPFLQLSPKAFVPKSSNSEKACFRVFCLGGSTTEFKDSKNIGWPERLERLLQARFPNRNIEVYNLGRQWYTIQHTLINYMINLRQHKPDVIIVMHAINDLLINADFSYYSSGPFSDDYRHFLGPLTDLVKKKNLMKTITSFFRNTWFCAPKSVVLSKEFPGLVPFERNMKTLISFAKAENVGVILMTQPHLLKDVMSPEEDSKLIMVHYEAKGPDKKWHVLTAKAGMEKYNEIAVKTAQDMRVPLIDLELALPKNLQYFTDEVHYQDRSFDLIAGYISENWPPSFVLK